MSYKVITPAGRIYVKSADEAEEYKRLFGYPYEKCTKKQLDPIDVFEQEQEEEQETWEREMYGEY